MAKEAFKATECPITRKQFEDSAKPIMVSLGGQNLVVGTKEFSTGSFGWFYGGKTAMEIDGVACKVQAQITLTVIGSKDAKKGGATAKKKPVKTAKKEEVPSEEGGE